MKITKKAATVATITALGLGSLGFAVPAIAGSAPVQSAIYSAASEVTERTDSVDRDRGGKHHKRGGFLQELVSNNTLTEAQANSVREALKENRPERPTAEERKELREKLRTMTPEERTTFFEEKKTERLNAMKTTLQQLVDDETITAEQQDAIVTAAEEQPHPKGRQGRGDCDGDRGGMNGHRG